MWVCRDPVSGQAAVICNIVTLLSLNTRGCCHKTQLMQCWSLITQESESRRVSSEHNHQARPCPIANTVCYYHSIVWDGPGVSSDQCVSPRGHPLVTGHSPLSSQHAGARVGDKYPHYLRADISEPRADCTEMFSSE